jgi:hypothetical protein
MGDLSGPLEQSSCFSPRTRQEFKVIELGTEVPSKIVATPDGGLKAEQLRWRILRVTYSPKSPESIRIWLDRYFDVNQILEEESKIVAVTGGGIIVFVEAIEMQRTYSLRPALHYYPYQVRDKSLLDP